MILERSFYERDTVQVAKELVGQILVRRTPEGETGGVIVETEAYLGKIDPAAHSYKGSADRVRVQYGPAGCAYVYLIYGMHWCFNITSGPYGVPEAVLIRALEPVDGLSLMAQRRGTDKPLQLCSGPGKLCRAMAIGRAQYGADLCSREDGLWLEAGKTLDTEATPRIGVDYAGEASLWPLRFVAKETRYSSKIHKFHGNTT